MKKKNLIKLTLKRINHCYYLVMRQNGRVVACGWYDSEKHAEEESVRLLGMLRKHK